MGKRFNLAALADEDLIDEDDSPALAPAVAVSVPAPAETQALPGDASPGRLTVAAELVTVNPLNKRPSGEDDEIASLAETMLGHGVIQPLVVCSVEAFLAEYPDQAGALERGSEWVALIGNRRLLAVRRAGLGEVDIIVNDDQAASMYEVMLIENGQRRDLPPLYEAEAMEATLRKSGISQRELSRRIGKSHVYISQRLALLKLIPELRAALNQGELKIELARQFGDLPEARQREIVAAGRPYRLVTGGNAVSTHVRRRNIRASTPAVAAESIRERFTPEELAELIRLLTSATSSTKADNVAAAD
jgi:ParB family chromosome partitioning protein